MVATCEQQQRIPQDETPIAGDAWRFAREADQPENAAIATTCGHPSRQAVRIFLGGDWATYCIDCWRRNRRTYRQMEGLLPQTLAPAEQGSTARLRKTFGRLFPKALHSR